MKTITLALSVLLSGLALAQSEEKNCEYKVYPNPAIESCYVNSSCPMTDIKIVDTNGKIIDNSIKSFTFSTISHNFYIFTSEFTPGLYFVSFTIGNNTYCTKFLKM